MQKPTAANDPLMMSTLANMILLNGYKIQPEAIACTDVSYREVERTWQERWLSRPWRPFKKTRTVAESVPSDRVLVIDRTIFCHPDLAEKIKQAIDRQTKVPVAPPPSDIIAKG